MRWLIFALGVALALGGAASIVSGVPYIRIEFGWTEVIAGTTALSAGIVTVALGAVLSALRSLELRLVESRPAADVPDLAFSQAEPMSLPTVATVLADDGFDAALHEPDVTPPTFVERDMTPVPASRPLMGRMRSKLSTMGTPGNDRAEPSVPLGPSPATERSSGVRPAASLAQRDGGEASYRRPPGVDQPELAPSRSYASPSVAPSTRAVTDDRVPSLIPSPRYAADVDAGPISAGMEAPTVVGRYESGGASYVLFSDGTIEVETEAGTHRFSSMEELKAYIDQQDGSAGI